MRQGNRLLIGRGYGVKNLSAGELAARREHHSAVLEYRRNRPEEIRERLELIANARAIQWNREYLASLSSGSRWDPEYLQSLTVSMRNQDNRPAMVPPPPSVAPPAVNLPADVYDGAELRALEFATAAECAASEPTDAEREELRTRDTAPETPSAKESNPVTLGDKVREFVMRNPMDLPRPQHLGTVMDERAMDPSHPMYRNPEPPAADLGTRETAPDVYEHPAVPVVKVGGRRRHVRDVPSAVVTTCPTCGKEFASDAARRGHMRVHKGAAE